MTSESKGTVRFRTSNNKVIEFKEAIHLPKCAVNLIPVSVFDKREGTVKFTKGRVEITDNKGAVFLDGEEKNGIYHLNCTLMETFKVARQQRPYPRADYFEAFPPTGSPSGMFVISDDEPLSAAFFGLSGEVSENSADFNTKLLQAHSALGHMSFRALRKLLGLRSGGTNPDCAACAMAKSRKATLAVKKTQPSTKDFPASAPGHWLRRRQAGNFLIIH